MQFENNPKKSLGQNFLIDKNIINKIIKIGNINKNKTVVEIGPGYGNLTEAIISMYPKKMLVIEKDKKLCLLLTKKFQNIKVINEDILDVIKNKSLTNNSLVFGNLPYNISTQILAHLITLKKWPPWYEHLIFMFQKEVADRIIAETNTKNYGRLSIISNWKMKIEKIIDIEPRSFSPSPKVKSTLLVFVPKKQYHIIKDPKNLEHITNIFFSQRRKMIKKPLKFLFNNFEEVSKKLSIDLKLRPQNLDHKTYYKICELYELDLIK